MKKISTKCQIKSPGVKVLVDGVELRCPSCNEDFDDRRIDFTTVKEYSAGPKKKKDGFMYADFKCLVCGCEFRLSRNTEEVQAETRENEDIFYSEEEIE